MQAPFRSALAVLVFLLPIAVGAQTRLSFSADDADPHTESLELVLSERGSLDLIETPLKNVAEELSRQFSVQIRLALKKLEEASVSPDTPVTIQIFNLPLESILRHALADIELTFTVRDGIILITTPEDEESNLLTRVYPVLDLFTPRTSGLQYQSGFAEDYHADLIDVITSTIAPDSWDAVGGPGAVEFLDNAGALIVSQTRDTHRKVEGLLTSLRRSKAYRGFIPRGLSPISPAPAPISYSARRLPTASPADIRSWQLPQVYRAER